METKLVEKPEYIEMPAIDLLKICELMNVIVCDVKIKFAKGKMIITAVDPSHVAMIGLEYETDWTTTTEVPEVVSLEIRTLREALKLAKVDRVKGERVSNKVRLYPGENGKLGVELIVGGVQYRTNLICLDSDTLNTPIIPSLKDLTTVTLDGLDFWKRVEFCRNTGDLAIVRVEKNVLEIGVNHTVAVDNPQDNQMRSCVTTSELSESKQDSDVKSQYSLTYLKPIAKVFKKQLIKIGFGEAYPLLISCDYDFEHNVESQMNVTYFLAPRVESDY